MSRFNDAIETIRVLIANTRTNGDRTPPEEEAWRNLCDALPWKCLHCGSVFLDEEEAAGHQQQISSVSADNANLREAVVLLDACVAQLESVNEALYQTAARRYVYGLPCDCAEAPTVESNVHDARCSKIRSLVKANKELIDQASRITRKEEVER